jgi:hypothetical protein
MTTTETSNLRPKGNPLTPVQLDAIARVTPDNEQEAIAFSHRTIRPFLNATRITTVLR